MTTKKRVIQKSTGMHGIVLEENEENSLVHWGSTQRKAANANEPPVDVLYTAWVPNDDLVLFEEPVFVHGDRGTKQTVKVYDPDEHRPEPEQ